MKLRGTDRGDCFEGKELAAAKANKAQLSVRCVHAFGNAAEGDILRTSRAKTIEMLTEYRVNKVYHGHTNPDARQGCVGD